MKNAHFFPTRKVYHEPLRTYDECAEALNLSVCGLNGLRKKTKLAFPKAVFKHNSMYRSRTAYYRLSEIRAWKALVDQELEVKWLKELAKSQSYVRAGLLAELVGEWL